MLWYFRGQKDVIPVIKSQCSDTQLLSRRQALIGCTLTGVGPVLTACASAGARSDTPGLAQLRIWKHVLAAAGKPVTGARFVILPVTTLAASLDRTGTVLRVGQPLLGALARSCNLAAFMSLLVVRHQAKAGDRLELHALVTKPTPSAPIWIEATRVLARSGYDPRALFGLTGPSASGQALNPAREAVVAQLAALGYRV